MARKLHQYLGYFGLNLLAAYLPSLYWMAAMSPDNPLAYLWSPVCLAVLWVWTLSDAVALAILAVFVLAILALSLLCYAWRFKWAVPGVIFAACFLQGLLSAALIAGINAIGHS